MKLSRTVLHLYSSLVKLSTWKLAAWVLHHIHFFLSWKRRCNWPFWGEQITFIISKQSLLIFQFYSQSTERQIFCASFVASVMCSHTSKMYCCISPQNRKDFSLIDFHFGVNFFPIYNFLKSARRSRILFGLLLLFLLQTSYLGKKCTSAHFQDSITYWVWKFFFVCLVELNIILIFLVSDDFWNLRLLDLYFQTEGVHRI